MRILLRRDDEYFAQRTLQQFDKARVVLQSFISEIEDYWDDDSPPAFGLSGEQGGEILSHPNGSKVFLAHGRDTGSMNEVARFLERIGLTPIILVERPNQGKTIIEKFESNSDVRFAIVLLTPDDVGGFQRGGNGFEPRARQNAIFELGFFIGKLGRDRVCALTKGHIEIPSNYSGVLYIPMDDAGGWKYSLENELSATDLLVP